MIWKKKKTKNKIQMLNKKHKSNILICWSFSIFLLSSIWIEHTDNTEKLLHFRLDVLLFHIIMAKKNKYTNKKQHHHIELYLQNGLFSSSNPLRKNSFCFSSPIEPDEIDFYVFIIIIFVCFVVNKAKGLIARWR